MSEQATGWAGADVTAHVGLVGIGRITLNRECPHQAKERSCGDWCALFEWLKPNDDHRKYRARLHCCGRVVAVNRDVR